MKQTAEIEVKVSGAKITNAEAWYAVCTNSKDLGHCRNSVNAKYDFEMTGSREVCGFYDLGNCTKYLERDKEDYTDTVWIVGCSYRYEGKLAKFYNIPGSAWTEFEETVGWLVFNYNELAS